MRWHRTTPLAIAAAIALTTTLSSIALALPRQGAPAPNASVADPDGRSLEVQRLRGKPALMLYEDAGSTEQNKVLKRELLALEQTALHRDAVHFAVVADVSAYSGFLTRGVAANKVRKHARLLGRPVYCDWDGAFRATLGLSEGQSNVLLLDANGRVMFASAGPLPERERTILIDLVREQVD